ncbi:MAG: hypothetical protein M1815_005780 [Lichina confinis]|nr:MAG: hypothetical protein M1815_005780 [Lichina confinis]
MATKKRIFKKKPREASSDLETGETVTADPAAATAAADTSAAPRIWLDNQDLSGVVAHIHTGSAFPARDIGFTQQIRVKANTLGDEKMWNNRNACLLGKANICPNGISEWCDALESEFHVSLTNTLAALEAARYTDQDVKNRKDPLQFISEVVVLAKCAGTIDIGNALTCTIYRHFDAIIYRNLPRCQGLTMDVLTEALGDRRDIWFHIYVLYQPLEQHRDDFTSGGWTQVLKTTATPDAPLTSPPNDPPPPTAISSETPPLALTDPSDTLPPPPTNSSNAGGATLAASNLVAAARSAAAELSTRGSSGELAAALAGFAAGAKAGLAGQGQVAAVAAGHRAVTEHNSHPEAGAIGMVAASYGRQASWD